MLITAAALGLAIGLVIGGLGGGGGVLAVPAMVYLLGQSAQDATTGSVLIVGVSAVVGALARVRGIDWRTGIAFGVAGIPTAYLGTWVNHRADQQALLLVFAAVTLIAAAAMLLTGPEPAETAQPVDYSGPAGSSPAGSAVVTRTRRLAAPGRLAKIAGCGLAAGFLTGFLGVGGGFLVLPALVLALRMPMPRAIGTSLLIIVLNAGASLVARLGDLALDWSVLGPFTVAAVLGTLLGKRIADRLSGPALTRAFAVLLVLIGLFVGGQSVLAG